MLSLYIVEYESAHFAAASYTCVTMTTSAYQAEDKTEDFQAEDKTEDFREDHMYETFHADSYEEEYDPPYSTVKHVMLMEGSEYEEFYNNSYQAEFYPMVD